jgi:glyoxylase-like metal-dependent hydrolase (beta-lactamase superfamily II)
MMSMLAMTLLLRVAAPQAEDFSKAEVATVTVAPGLAMLAGPGGNIGVSTGDDGVFLIDDEYAPLTDKVTAAISLLSDKPVRFLVNTHWHGDHTGGNENLGKAGVVIVAQENVRKRMSVEQFLEAFGEKVAASPKLALPVITFADAVTFHMNGDDIRVFHVAPAHTDGDSIIQFQKANVVHMGDVFFNGMYPFIDVSTGGHLEGMIAAVDQVLPMLDAGTKIIPGHGPVSDKAALGRYREMLAAVRDAVKPLVAAGKSRSEAIAAKPTRALDGVWGNGFLKPDVFVGIVYDGMLKRQATAKR